MKDTNTILGNKQGANYFVYELIGTDLQYIMDNDRKKIMYVSKSTGMIIAMNTMEYSCNFAHFLFFAKELLNASIAFKGDGYFEKMELKDEVKFSAVVKEIDFQLRAN